MVRVDDRDEWTWEAWINVHAEGLPNPLPDLLVQEHLDLLLFSDADTPDRALRVSNGLDWPAIVAGLTSRSWTMREYDAAREAVYQRHPDVQSLWRAIG